VESVSFPTQQWIERSIAALNTNTAPDLIFNNYERVIRVEDQTEKILDLSDALAEVPDTDFLSEGDLAVSRYGGKTLILPVQRVQMAFGVRRSWLEAVDEEFPRTVDDMVRIAEKFQQGDPDGNGVDGDTFGLALQAANPRDLVHMMDLFTFGTGLRHTVIDPEGNIVINEPDRRALYSRIVEIYREYTAQDTINHSFTEMYQVIEGNRAGMFRVGDWNVNKWDQADVLDGDYVIGPWPEFPQGDSRNVVIGGMRGVAVPENAPNREEAVAFAQFMLSREAQRLSFEHIGAAVRGDWELDLRPHQRFFAQPDHNLVAYDFPESIHPFYPQIEEIFHRELLGALADPNADVGQVLVEAEEKILEYIENNT
jgi:ABC-type glycerol-3-phosphate transport system substrate-binding protein